MKKVADLQPGDIVNIGGQPFTVKSVYTSGGSTTLVFEDVPATCLLYTSDAADE